MARVTSPGLCMAACFAVATFAGGCSDTANKTAPASKESVQETIPSGTSPKEATPPSEERAPTTREVAASALGTNPSPKEGASEEGQVGVLLEGERNASAMSAIQYYSANDTTTPDEIGTSASGARFDRTNLSVAITLQASVGEVNDLLGSIDGRIVSMAGGTAILLVKIPDPGDIPSLEKVAAKVGASPIVRRVTLAGMGGMDVFD